MNKVVINCSYTGFSLSAAALSRYDELAEAAGVDPYDVPRHCPILVEIVETMGAKANGTFSDLQIVEVEGNLYRVEEHYGKESVVTPEQQTWITIN